MNTEERIVALEKKLCHINPGTILSRARHPTEGLIWSLAIGAMNKPKLFYTGKTINELLTTAEKSINRLNIDANPSESATTEQSSV